MSVNKDKIALVIVDDHPIVIQGLQSLLQAEKMLYIAGTFTTGSAALSFLQEQKRVDIILLDITLPDMHGVELCKEIKMRSPQTKILTISNHNERSIIMQMLQHGASGYLLKNASSEELLKCIYEVLEDKIALSAEVTAIITRPQQSQLKQVFNLTKREKQVLSMIAAGQTSASIAAELYISPFTVETHRRNLMQKFDASNTATLIKMAVEQRLV